MASYREHRQQLKRRRRNAKVRSLVSLFIGGLVLFAGLFFLLMPNYRGGIRGTVTGQSSEAPATPSRRYLSVRLDDGRTVQAGISNREIYRPGRRVMLKEITNRLFGYKWYQITGPIDGTNTRRTAPGP